jgi:hypothetical protein
MKVWIHCIIFITVLGCWITILVLNPMSIPHNPDCNQYSCNYTFIRYDPISKCELYTTFWTWTVNNTQVLGNCTECVFETPTNGSACFVDGGGYDSGCPGSQFCFSKTGFTTVIVVEVIIGLTGIIGLASYALLIRRKLTFPYEQIED